MRFLVDNPVSPKIAAALSQAGHDSIHVTEIGLGDADDEEIFARAVADSRIIITQDTDFGFLQTSVSVGTGVILFRIRDGRPQTQIGLLRKHLHELEADLSVGAIAVFSDGAIRVRKRIPD